MDQGRGDRHLDIFFIDIYLFSDTHNTFLVIVGKSATRKHQCFPDGDQSQAGVHLSYRTINAEVSGTGLP